MARVERALKKVPGVEDAAVNFATEQATIRFGPEPPDIGLLTGAVQDAGYEASEVVGHTHPGSGHHSVNSVEPHNWSRDAVVAAALGVPVAVMGMAWPGRLSGILQAALCAVLLTVVGRQFIVGAVRSAMRLVADMDTLIALGTLSAFVYSVYTLASGHTHFYFDTTAVIIALIAIGKLMEMRARTAAASAVTRLLDLSPSMATRESDGREVSVAELVPGDVVLVRPGGRVPVDGAIESGTSTLDESTVTGESMPLNKAAGDRVIGGTMNLTGQLSVRVEKIGADTVLGQVAAMVNSALTTKAGLQRLADRIAGVFVPIVIAIAAITVLAWGLQGSWDQGIHAAVAVLIVACPCALGLATPAAIMVGCAVGARRGVLIRTPAVLERIGTIDTVVLDKTGTLTIGKPRVATVIATDPAGASDVATVAAAVEQGSEHPLARAIVAYAADAGLTLPRVTAFVSEAGGGVRAMVAERLIGVGRLRDLELTDELRMWRARGASVSGVFELPPGAASLDDAGRRLIGAIALTDTMRPGARAAMDRLHSMNLDTVLLTGDHQGAADLAAREAGITTVIAGVLPAGKLDVIQRLQREGKNVVMVGDGVNDAAALAAANVGIAMGEGTDIAKEAGDIVLVSSDPSLIPTAIALSHAMRRRIHLGLGWAFVYNFALIPVAALGWLNPMLAAAAMSVSSVSVVGNALFLSRFRQSPMGSDIVSENQRA